MQKQVSRQSIAIVALSILLTIAIAMTFTFAAFTGKATVEGTITISNGFTLTVINEGEASGLVTFTNNAITFSFTDTHFDMSAPNARDEVEATLSDATKAELAKVSVQIENASNKPVFWRASVPTDQATALTTAKWDLTFTTLDNVAASATVTKDLTEIFNIASTNVQAGEVTFTITIEAQYDDFGA